MPGLWTLLGLVVLVAGGELVVRGAVAIAARVGVSPLVIGLTVVAFGTSSPELAVSLQSSLAGEADLAVGNVVGSNIANILLILGLASVFAPLDVSSQLVRWDVPLMIAVSIAFWILSANGVLSRGEGILLFASLLAYVAWSVRASRRETRLVQAEFEAEYGEPAAVGKPNLPVKVVVLTLGLAMLVVGSDWLVDGASRIATLLGVSELVIGLTIVAIGTSMPEVVTSLVATWKGERDIAVGNVVGSNLFNILCVLGLSAAVSPQGIAVNQVAIGFDIPVMTVVAAACLPIFFSGHRLSRGEGTAFLAYFAAYLAYRALMSVQSPATEPFKRVMVTIILPLTGLAILIGVLREAVRRKRN
jgi:cation:H+ antiporter